MNEAHRKLFRDGGYASRKLWFSMWTSVSVLLSGALAATWPAFRPSLETVIGGVVGVLALYLGGNIGTKAVMGKALKGMPLVQEASPEVSAEVSPDPKKEGKGEEVPP